MRPVDGSLTWADVIAWRMQRQYLNEPAAAGAAIQVVSRLCGVQAQVQSAAELALWARLERLEPGEVSRALWEDRRLVKTWAMRGTLHLLPAEEYGLWQAALSTIRNYERGSWTKYFGVSPEQLDLLFRAVPQVLEGRFLSRDELADAVTSETGSASLGDSLRESWGAVLKPFSFRGCLCLGPSAGQSTRFTLPRTWLDPWQSWEPVAALREMTRRYLGAYGPATREELARWWRGVSPAQAGKLLAGLGDEAVEVDVEGERRILLCEHLSQVAAAGPPGGVHLLPAFDQWVITAPREPEAFLSAEFRARVYRPQGWLSPVILVDGRIEGTWSLAGSGKGAAVALEPFRPLPEPVRRAAEAAAERLTASRGGRREGPATRVRPRGAEEAP